MRIPAGSTSDACLSTVDLLPILLALLSLSAPPDVEGLDLSHCACGAAGVEPDAAFMQICGATVAWEDGNEWRALRDKSFYRVDQHDLLFDNQVDPYQLHNLVDGAGQAATIARLWALLRSKMAQVQDTFEACPLYRDHWTDGQRNIIRSAICDFGG